MYPNQPLNSDSEYWTSLKKDLKKTKKLTSFIPLQGLTNAARYHAKDMGLSGKIGHESTNGMTASERGEKFAGTPYVGENCSYGYDDPLFIVGQLLVDDGVPSLGHRRNILDTEYDYYAVGVAIEPHEKYGYNCVIDYALKVEGRVDNFEQEASAITGSGDAMKQEFEANQDEKKNWKTVFSYDGGKFQKKMNSKDWREKTNNGVVFHFKEIMRKDKVVVLFDEPRGVWLSLNEASLACDYSANGSDWALLYYLKKN